MTAIVDAILAELDGDDAALERLAERLAPWLAPAPVTSAWLDVEAAATHISAPRSRLYALVSAKRVPHHRDGSRLLFDRSELDEWVRNGGGRRP